MAKRKLLMVGEVARVLSDEHEYFSVSQIQDVLKANPEIEPTERVSHYRVFDEMGVKLIKNALDTRKRKPDTMGKRAAKARAAKAAAK